MATALSASTQSHHSFHDQQYAQEDQVGEGSYSEQEDCHTATIETWKSLADTMREAIAVMHFEDELKDVAIAEAAVQKVEKEREAIIQDLNNEGEVLLKTLKKAKQSALRPQNQPTAEGHLAEVDRLEREVKQVRKQLTEEETLISKKQSDLKKWEEDKEEVSKLEVGDEGAWADGKVIRLKLFTEAGFTLIPGQGNTASKVMIRDEAKSDIHTLSLDNSRSKTHNANFIWGLAGE